MVTPPEDFVSDSFAEVELDAAVSRFVSLQQFPGKLYRHAHSSLAPKSRLPCGSFPRKKKHSHIFRRGLTQPAGTYADRFVVVLGV